MSEYRAPYRGAFAAAAALFILYVVTLAPTTAFWDTSEYIATAHIVGIPHPPGNPLFVALAKVWTLLLAPLGLSVAVRVNLFAAATSAATVGFLFLVAHRILSALRTQRAVPLVGAAAAAVLSGTTYTVWNQSNVNEKVYTVSLLVIAAVSWLALRWKDRRDEPGSIRYLVLAAYLVVLGSTNHLMSVLPGPALALFVLLIKPGVLLRRDLWVRAVPAVFLALSFNFFLPIRAELDPVINEGDPTCETVSGAAVAVFTQGRAGCAPLAASLRREQYAKPPVTERQAPLGYQLLNYFQYFDWQWARRAAVEETPGNARVPFTVVFMVLGLLGLWVILRLDREIFSYVAVLVATVTVGLVFYLNFKYGFSLAPEVTDRTLHEVRERDYFFIVSFSLWGMLAGIGLASLWHTLRERLGTARSRLAAAPIMGIALLPLVLNWPWASRSGDYAARDWAYDLLASVEPYGVLFTNGDNDTFPLWYLQEVEGIRKDVTVVVVQYLYTTWYPRQLQELTVPGRQRPFVAASTASPHEAPPGMPGQPIVTIAPEDMDRIVGGRFDEDFTIGLGDIAVAYPAGSALNRAQLLALAIIRDSIDERPVHFASSAGLMAQLGLSRWGVRHGLSTKLALRRLEDATPGLIQVSSNLGGEWLDLERSLTLTRDVYSYRGIRERDIWQDRSTLNIPWHYYLLHLQLQDAARQAAMDEELVEALGEEAERFRLTAQGGRLALTS